MKTTAPIPFAGSQLAENRHVCAFFNSEEEEYRVLLPFVQGGFDCGHKAVHVVNSHQRSEHLKRLVAAGGHSYIDDLIEFESRVNHIWEHHDDAVICTYHLGQFGGDAVIDIMRTHPMVIIGGILQRNPFFVPPSEFLRELRERRTGRSTSTSAGS